MSIRPTFSIIMPAWNAAGTIVRAIRSVQAQTFKNWELIIIDDGSTDPTASICESLMFRDARISLIYQENAGPSSARNNGLAAARGRYITFLDADDTWAPERLSGMKEAFSASPETGVFFSRTRFIDFHTEKSGILTPHWPAVGLEHLLAENPACSTSNLVCRSAVFKEVGGFAEGLDFAEDQEWLVRVALTGHWKISGIDAEWLFYQSSTDSQSSDLEAMKLGWLRLLENARGACPGLNGAILVNAHGIFHRQLARRALRLRQPKQALAYLWQGLSLNPSLLLRQPKRTFLTLAGAVLACFPGNYFKELVAR